MINTEYFYNKRKLKNFPILSLSKIKNTKENIISNKSLNSISSSDFNSISFSSKKIKQNHKNSNNNSDKSVKPYEAYKINLKQINRTQESSEAKLKKSFLINLSNNNTNNNISDGNSREKLFKLLDNKNNKLLFSRKRKEYQNSYGNNNKMNLFKTPLNKDLKLKNIYYNKKRITSNKKINNTILKKFEGDFHNFYLNSLKKTKDEFKNKMDKINKTFYKCSLTKVLKLNKIKNLKKTNIGEESGKKHGNNNYSNKKHISNIDEISYISKSSSRSKKINENKIMKINYSTQLLKVNENYKRKRNFKQYMNEKKIMEKKWKLKLGVIDTTTKYNPLLIKDLKFQSGIIKDELCILLEDIHHFRFTFFEEQDICSAIKNKSIKYQIKLNKMLEETCALLHLIPKIILKEYYFYSDKFISIADPSRELFSKKIVYNEVDCFQENLKYLYKILNYVNCCNVVYSQLIQQVEDEMIISLQNFQLFRTIFEKIRHYIINLTNICKNTLKDYIFDKHIITKFKEAIKKSNNSNKDKKKDNIINIIKNDETYDYSEYNENSKNDNLINYEEKNLNNEEEQEDEESNEKKWDKRLKFGDNFYSQKLARISKALESNNSDDKKKLYKGVDTFKEKMAVMAVGSSGPMALINSPLMTKMLKYIKKDYKQKIISLRTSERFLANKI